MNNLSGKGSKEKVMIHPCNCTSYNGGQCYNCLNGAHAYCPDCKRKRNSKKLGLTIIVKSHEK